MRKGRHVNKKYFVPVFAEGVTAKKAAETISKRSWRKEIFVKFHIISIAKDETAGAGKSLSKSKAVEGGLKNPTCVRLQLSSVRPASGKACVDQAALCSNSISVFRQKEKRYRVIKKIVYSGRTHM